MVGEQFFFCLVEALVVASLTKTRYLVLRDCTFAVKEHHPHSITLINYLPRLRINYL